MCALSLGLGKSTAGSVLIWSCKNVEEEDILTDPLHVVNTQALVVLDGRFVMILRNESEEQATGVLSPPGGEVKHGEDATGILEDTLLHEVLEETGVSVGEMAYIRSRQFTMDRGTIAVDTAFLCQYQSGDTYAADRNEVTGVEWLTTEEIEAHPKTRP